MGNDRIRHRVRRQGDPTLRNWDAPGHPQGQTQKANVTTDCGWGRLVFAQTFSDNGELAKAICDEPEDRRNIAIYIRDPHVVLSLRPQDLFLDPSHTYRLWLYNYRASRVRPQGFDVRRAKDADDARAITRLLATRRMVAPEPTFLEKHITSRALTHFVAEDSVSGQIVGTVMGVDHKRVFDDVEGGSSLWALAVDPQAGVPGIGRALVACLADHYSARGRNFMDLSVMHDNTAVIRLYEDMGFQRIPAFCIKKKNAINETLYTPPDEDYERLNPYARIIVDEARRRGIGIEIIDASMGYFSLGLGGTSIMCRESLSERTTAVAMSCCDDKRITQKMLCKAGINVPAWRDAESAKENAEFLERYASIVVKPARGEQGNGVTVGVNNKSEMAEAIEDAGHVCEDVIIEEFVEGQDLRVVMINHETVAAAVRRPAEVTGNGRDTARTLIEKQSRRRAAATGGESRIVIDEECVKCLRDAGLDPESVIEEGQTVPVRKTANLHTGGTLEDVTDKLHPELIRVAERCTRTLNIPVAGLDFIVDAPDQPEYHVIEVNERPGLANHEPQPTAERFIDFLFPQTTA